MQLWRSMVDWLGRVFAPAPLLFTSGDGWPASPGYDQISAMSTLARFPWIWTCVQAISSDMAGLPLVAFRPAAKGRRGSREMVQDPLLDRLRQPNVGMSGWLFMKQSWVDYDLTGNAYWYHPTTVAIYRLHPACTRAIPGPWGMPLGYEYRDSQTGQITILPADQVTHIRDVSWADDVSQIYGESPIRCLHDDLVTDLGARETQAKIAAKGRPDVLFAVKALGGAGGGKSEELVKRWEAAIAQRHGAFVVGGEVTATPLSWTPKDINDLPRATALRDMTLAVFGVPPTRAGLTTASYGASRQEMRAYWENLISRARAFEAALSSLAGPGVRIEYDFTGVESMQVSYTERLMRVATWVGMGATPLAAAEYELFDGAPVPDQPMVDTFHSPRPIDRQPAESGGGQPTKALELAVATHLRCAEAAYAELDESVDRSLFVRWQSEQLFAGLERAGLVGAEARVWAEELCGVTDEMHQMGLAAFAPERAAKVAERISAAREAA